MSDERQRQADTDPSNAPRPADGGGPRRLVKRGAREYLLLGTAHVSRASADEVRAEIETGDYDEIAIELCDARHATLTRQAEVAEMDLFAVIRKGQAGMVAASLALGAYQQRLADQFGIEPGAEMRAAINAAEAGNTPLSLVDRNIGITLKRVYRNIPWWQRATVLTGLATSLVSSDKISEDDIEKLKEGDMLESTFNEFAAESSAMHAALIDERDQYMAAKLLAGRADAGRTLVVIGAGHLKGLAGYLEAGMDDPAARVSTLDTVPPGARWVRWIPWIVVALVFAGFALGFSKSAGLGQQLVIEWVVINGALSALGTAVALGHPLSIVTAFIAAPITSLNPTIGAGMVVAAAEVWLRKPRVGDFSTLKADVTSLRGWWRNRVSRTLLVFLGATLGSAAGTYIAGFRIVGQLFG
ncbi:TraB/GumN family protein [Salinisphaera japonica]|uniref:Conjugal transfer protein TraB n=1 Tax=Salinisphaera japonica YTM-1 TaxID=1209778 RepID=A0A423PZL7_9GAMM|nr:TraB/GumN family protein [Salinisphaera japonica]ROO31162.1 conjugal transfer protein TraB [Salinisphaera japonica YTM-1]